MERGRGIRGEAHSTFGYGLDAGRLTFLPAPGRRPERSKRCRVRTLGPRFGRRRPAGRPQAQDLVQLPKSCAGFEPARRLRRSMAQMTGIEPASNRLTVDRSTSELHMQNRAWQARPERQTGPGIQHKQRLTAPEG